ncbi:MAG: tetratricopeptide repeat protein [Candidatus Paceibacterota bacterium]|jgi:tetratricopeptide (TPR) repeat protein
MTENSNQASSPSWLSSFATKWTGAIFMGIFLLLPLVVSPFRSLSADFTKHFVLLVGILFVSFLCLVSFHQRPKRAKSQKIITYGLVAVTISALLAACFSENFFLSFFGLGFEKDTFVTILVMVIAALLPSFIYQGKDDLPKFSFWLAMVASLVVILETVFLMLIKFTGFNFLASFVGLVSNSWYEEATFLGLIVVLVLSLFEFFAKKFSTWFSFFLIFSLVTSLLFLGLINYWAVWLLLAIFSALIVILAIRRGGWIEILNISTLVLVISLSFVIWGGTNSWLGRLSVDMQQSAKINILEVRPSWTGTYEIAAKVYQSDPVFGAGPSRFWRVWNLYKPTGVNLTPFWNTDFSYGIGLVPSLSISHGLVGGLAWLGLLLAIIFSAFVGLKNYWQKSDEKNALVVLAIMPVLYLWSLLVFRSPSLCVMALAFVFLGWFMASEKGTTSSSTKFRDIFRRLSWPILALLLALVIYLIVGYLSLFALQRSLSALNQGKYDRASTWIDISNKLYRSDVFERQATSVKLAQINQLIKTSTGDPEQVKANFLTLFNSALKHAANAQKIDPNNYTNWLNIARVYGLAVSLGVDGAANQAFTAYQKAVELNPTNPGIWFEMSQLSLASKKTEEARERLGHAITLKPNYLEARFALAQLDLNDGLITKAITEATEVVKLSPEDYNAWFLLGYLKYQHGDIEEAAQIFARSLQIQPNYADAKYFIGLSLDQMGRDQEALGVFKDLVSSNPGNKALEKIVDNLIAGRSALSQPVVEKTTTKTKK